MAKINWTLYGEMYDDFTEIFSNNDFGYLISQTTSLYLVPLTPYFLA